MIFKVECNIMRGKLYEVHANDNIYFCEMNSVKYSTLGLIGFMDCSWLPRVIADKFLCSEC